MTTNLNALIAAEHAADLHRSVRRHGPMSTEAPSTPKTVAIRRAGAGDAHALDVLSELDEAPALSGEAMLALIDGEPVAAISLEDGRVISDPFVATRDAVALLKLGARRQATPRARRPRRLWHPRFA